MVAVLQGKKGRPASVPIFYAVSWSLTQRSYHRYAQALRVSIGVHGIYRRPASTWGTDCRVDRKVCPKALG
jgi:hypothetical protein